MRTYKLFGDQLFGKGPERHSASQAYCIPAGIPERRRFSIPAQGPGEGPQAQLMKIPEPAPILRVKFLQTKLLTY